MTRDTSLARTFEADVAAADDDEAQPGAQALVQLRLVKCERELLDKQTSWRSATLTAAKSASPRNVSTPGRLPPSFSGRRRGADPVATTSVLYERLLPPSMVATRAAASTCTTVVLSRSVTPDVRAFEVNLSKISYSLSRRAVSLVPGCVLPRPAGRSGAKHVRQACGPLGREVTVPNDVRVRLELPWAL